MTTPGTIVVDDVAFVVERVLAIGPARHAPAALLALEIACYDPAIDETCTLDVVAPRLRGDPDRPDWTRLRPWYDRPLPG